MKKKSCEIDRIDVLVDDFRLIPESPDHFWKFFPSRISIFFQKWKKPFLCARIAHFGPIPTALFSIEDRWRPFLHPLRTVSLWRRPTSYIRDMLIVSHTSTLLQSRQRREVWEADFFAPKPSSTRSGNRGHVTIYRCCTRDKSGTKPRRIWRRANSSW